MTMLTPSTVPTPYRSDGEYYSFTKMIETIVSDGLTAHQDAVNTMLLNIKTTIGISYNIQAVQTLVFIKAPPMVDQHYLTVIHYGAIAAANDGPAISGL